MATKKSVPNHPKAMVISDTLYSLLSDYQYEWDLEIKDPTYGPTLKNRITIQSGFRWDGASIPKLFWSIGFKPDGPHRAAALVHDFIYIYKGKLPKGSFHSKSSSGQWNEQFGFFSRKDSDRLFGKMMRDSGVPRLRRFIMKIVVMLLGWIYWQDGPDLMRGIVLRIILIGMFIYLIYLVQNSTFVL